MTKAGKILYLAGILSFAVAVFQTIITFSPRWSLFFGAPKEIVSNYPLLLVTGLVAALFFTLFGIYALSGAGRIRPLPGLRIGLLFITAIYILRGMMVIPVILIMAGAIIANEPVTFMDLVSSLVSLLIGVVYLFGIIGRWHALKQNK